MGPIPRNIAVALAAILATTAHSGASADELYVLTATKLTRQVQIFDTRTDTEISRFRLRDRVMPIDDAIKLLSAVPWGGPGLPAGDLIAQRKAGAKTAKVDAFPDMIAAADGYFYGAIGEDQPGFAYEIESASGHAIYHDIFERHANAVFAVRRRVFVSDWSAGLFWADPATGRAHRVDDRYDDAIRIRRFVRNREEPDPDMDSYARAMRKGLMLGGCADMTAGPDRRTLYVAGHSEDQPVVFAVDIAAAKLIGILRLGDDVNATFRALGTAENGDVYAALLSHDGKTLGLYRIDGGSGQALGRWDLDVASLAKGDEPDCCHIAVGGDRLFLTIGKRFLALPLADPSAAAASIDVPERPGGLLATRDGRKAYLAEKDLVPVTLTEDGKLVVGASLPLLSTDWGFTVDTSPRPR